MSKSLFERTRFKLGWIAENDKHWAWTNTDPEIYIFFEKGAKGGVSYIANKCGKTNNKCLQSLNKNYKILK